ncbi:MAG: helix-turn-helix domain-containing protein [Pseudomonadota bacterium]
MSLIIEPLDFSRTVRARRRALGLTQRELASAAGLGRVSVLRLENEPEKCQLRTALRVASVLGLNLAAQPDNAPPGQAAKSG